MALTEFQRTICRLIAANRIASGASYVAGAVALNELLGAARVSRDSAFRFFPLVQHEELGLTLHPFDLATNKVLALVGRLEARDWIDVIECDGRLQPLGYLAWAACGKDPGFSPAAILEHAARTARYTQSEIDDLAFADGVPNAGELSRRWHAMLNEARQIVTALPVEEAGTCVLGPTGALYRGSGTELRSALQSGPLVFHPGQIHGALPRLVTGARAG